MGDVTHIHGGDGWTVVATWTPHPARDNTCTVIDRERPARRQAILWARCPGAVHVSLADPHGRVVAEWTRGQGWVRHTAGAIEPAVAG